MWVTVIQKHDDDDDDDDDGDSLFMDCSIRLKGNFWAIWKYKNIWNR